MALFFQGHPTVDQNFTLAELPLGSWGSGFPVHICLVKLKKDFNHALEAKCLKGMVEIPCRRYLGLIFGLE